MAAKTTNPVKSYLVIGGLCVAAIAGGSSLAMLKRSSKEAVPKDLTVDALRAQAKETAPGQIFDKMRETMQREDLTDAQRQKVRDNMREVGRQMMEERVDEYFKAETDEDKNAILDKQIDEFIKMREEWEKRRAEREKDGEKRDDRPGQGWMAQQSQQERKERSESRSADQMAKVMVYFNAMQARADERGIKMPGRGPGGWGGGPGGPGGGGGAGGGGRGNRGP